LIASTEPGRLERTPADEHFGIAQAVNKYSEYQNKRAIVLADAEQFTQ
jgi:hypothetical protein